MFFPQFTVRTVSKALRITPSHGKPSLIPTSNQRTRLAPAVQSEDNTCPHCPIRRQDLHPLSNQRTRLALAVQNQRTRLAPAVQSEDKTCARCPIRKQNLPPLSNQRTRLAPAVQSGDKTHTRWPIRCWVVYLAWSASAWTSWRTAPTPPGRSSPRVASPAWGSAPAHQPPYSWENSGIGHETNATLK